MHPTIRLLPVVLALAFVACGDESKPSSTPATQEPSSTPPAADPTPAPTPPAGESTAAEAPERNKGLATHFRMDTPKETPPAAKELVVTDKGPYQVEIPADAPKSVVQAREGKAGDEVVVAGRVKEIVQGFAAFKLIDDSLKWCGRDHDCGCDTPWDYCCEDPDAVRSGTMAVELRDAEGNPIEADKLGLRVLDFVVVKGRLEGTEAGGLVIVTDKGWDLRSRPDLGVKEKLVEWPN